MKEIFQWINQLKVYTFKNYDYNQIKLDLITEIHLNKQGNIVKIVYL